MKKITIAISGPPGAGSSTIAKKLSEKLKLNYFSPGKLYKSLSEKKQEAVAALELWKTKEGSSKEIHKLIDEMQLEKAKEGNIIIDGKLSIRMLKDVADIKIWIDVPIEERAKRAVERDKIPYNQALKDIKEREKLEIKNWEKIYGFNYLKQKNEADVIFDNSNKTADEAVNEIINILKEKGFL